MEILRLASLVESFLQDPFELVRCVRDGLLHRVGTIVNGNWRLARRSRFHNAALGSTGCAGSTTVVVKVNFDAGDAVGKMLNGALDLFVDKTFDVIGLVDFVVVDLNLHSVKSLMWGRTEARNQPIHYKEWGRSGPRRAKEVSPISTRKKSPQIGKRPRFSSRLDGALRFRAVVRMISVTDNGPEARFVIREAGEGV